MTGSEKEEQLAKQHAEALAEMYLLELRGKLLQIATRNAGGNVALAEEALQEALTSFVRHYDPTGGAPPEAWLVLTLKRACWRGFERERYGRRAGQELWPGEEGSGVLMELITAPGCLEDQVLERVEAERRLAQLKPDERASLELQAAGFSYDVIAQHKGWTYTKAHRCIKEGRVRLRTRE